MATTAVLSRARPARPVGGNFELWSWYFFRLSGLLLRPISNTLYAMPPYLLDEEAVQHLAASALAALEDTLAQENHS